jgi:hypothetical protein
VSACWRRSANCRRERLCGNKTSLPDYRLKRTLIVAVSEVYAARNGSEKLVAKATVTLAPVEKGK